MNTAFKSQSCETLGGEAKKFTLAMLMSTQLLLNPWVLPPSTKMAGLFNARGGDAAV